MAPKKKEVVEEKPILGRFKSNLKIGIVGMPNVGKSTLFNLMSKMGIPAENFPFCTIEPNIGKVKVPDPRLYELAKMANSEKVVPEMIEYVDIAGLVKGASKGEGLGNKFLSNIRMTDAIVHVVRCFDDEDVVHVDGSVNPRRDIETINLELVFADLDQCERRMKRVAKDALQKMKGAAEEKEALEKIIAALMEGKPARTVELTDKQAPLIKQLNLITMKPMIYAGNVSEEELATGNAFFDVVKEVAAETDDQAVMVSAQVEGELAGLDEEEKKEYLESLGVKESGCESLTRASYKLLGLRTYFTVGPKEAHAWTIREGWKAPRAAGVIHTDFEDGFIKAQAISFEDLIECGSEEAAQKKGLMRIEGKDYVVQEGDVMLFKFRD